MNDDKKTPDIGTIIVVVIIVIICAIVGLSSGGSGSSSKKYYDNKGREHATQSDADVWNEVDEWMDKNW